MGPGGGPNFAILKRIEGARPLLHAKEKVAARLGLVCGASFAGSSNLEAARCSTLERGSSGLLSECLVSYLIRVSWGLSTACMQALRTREAASRRMADGA